MITIQQANHYFKYDAQTGMVYWNNPPKRSKVKRGDKIGNSGRYPKVSLLGEEIKVQYLVWLFEHGTWASGIIDHIDHNPHNNHISNLRDTTLAENNKNRKLYNTNTTGLTGVVWEQSRNKWKVTIGEGTGKQKHIGRYSTLFGAAAARKSAVLKYSYHVNHGVKYE